MKQINISVIKPELSTEKQNITISMTGEAIENKVQARVKLFARKTLDGNVIIFDHKDVDIVLMPKEKKIVAFPKETLGTEIYETQDRLFAFLSKRGIINRESIQGGAAFYSMEASVVESVDKNISPIQVALYSIGKFIEKERPFIEFEKEFDEAEEARLTHPDPEESTDLDPEKYHREKKGANRWDPRYGVSGIYTPT